MEQLVARNALQSVAGIRYMVRLLYAVTKSPDGLHDLGLRVYHRIGSMEHIRKHDYMRLVVQFNVYRRVEPTGEKIYSCKFGQAVAYIGEILLFEFSDALIGAKHFTTALQFERLNQSQNRIGRIYKDADRFIFQPYK